MNWWIISSRLSNFSKNCQNVHVLLQNHVSCFIHKANVQSLRCRILCEAYEVRFEFLFSCNNHNNHPYQKDAALHSGEGPSCEFNLPFLCRTFLFSALHLFLNSGIQLIPATDKIVDFPSAFCNIAILLNIYN